MVPHMLYLLAPQMESFSATLLPSLLASCAQATWSVSSSTCAFSYGATATIGF